MKIKLSYAVLCFVWLWWPIVATSTQPRKPLIFTVGPKPATAQLKPPDKDAYELRGKLSFTVTAAQQADDTLVGVLVFTIPDDERRKLASLTSKPLNQIPAYVSRNNVAAGFRKDAACPIIPLEIAAVEFELAGAQVRLERVAPAITESPAYLNQLFCNWARQINAGRSRRGIIAAINRAIAPDDEAETKPTNSAHD